MNETKPLSAVPPALWRMRGSIIPGFLALILYCVTLSRGAYPGLPAAHIASAAGLAPDSMAAHPLWKLLTGWLAHVPLFPLALRLNLFSAVCAAGAIGLLGLIMKRWMLSILRHGWDGLFEPMRPTDGDVDEKSEQAFLPGQSYEAALSQVSERGDYDRHVALAARIGGWCAALALAVSAPFWTAATRLTPHPFDVLLLLLTVALMLAHAERPSWMRALAAAALCGLGCVESEIFLPLAPVLFLLLIRNRIRVIMAWERHAVVSLLAAVVGAGTGFLLVWLVRAQADGVAPGVRSVVGDVLRAHYAMLGNALPRSGWAWIMWLVFTPLMVMIGTAKRAFGGRSVSLILLHVALTVAAALCLLNAPFTPWDLARTTLYLPVPAALAVAAVIGYLVAYWMMLYVPRDTVETQPDVKLQPDVEPVPRSHRAIMTLSLGLAAPPIVVILVAAFLNWGVADGRKGAFVDTLAQDVLDRLGGRTWIVSNGMLDNHLLILARKRRIDLRLVSLADGTSASWSRRMKALIEAEPAFAEHRALLHNALARGPESFVQECLAIDPKAQDRLLIVGVPEFWTLAGYRPIPEGFAVSGVRDLDALRDRDLLGPNRAYWKRMARVLASDESMPFGLARFQTVLRREAGRQANNLGVVLTDLERPEEACEAFAAAREIDARNLSAMLNHYALTEGEAQAEVTRALTARLKEEKRVPPLPIIVRAYGDIRQPGVLTSYGASLASSGQMELARSEFARALQLGTNNVPIHEQLASLAMRQGRADEGEQAYREVLAARPNDAAAMAGLASVALARGRHEEANTWLEAARSAGAPEKALTIPTVARLVAAGRSDEALAQLRAMTDADVPNIEALALLADLLLRQNQTSEVERRVVPAMVKAVGPGDHVLIHLVRAKLLRVKQPVDFAGSRASLLHALRLRPDLAVIRDDWMQLVFDYGSLADRESDASAVLRAEPHHAFANYLLATVLLERGELAQAETLFRRSLATLPTALAHNDLAETLRRLKRLEDAEREARAALAQDDTSFAAWDTLACVLLDLGRLDEAAQAASRAITLCERDPRLHLTLARVCVAQGRTQEALRILNQPVMQISILPPELSRDVALLTKQAVEARDNDDRQ
ncbi:MAG: tetratricopeptide repeat protein [Lentisphaerae bacterium]|nr:tetratricopeptide repeat protein [Lentisphaerota bacterium]